MVEGQRNGIFNQNGKLGHSCARVMKKNVPESQVKVHLCINFALNCGCVVNAVFINLCTVFPVVASFKTKLYS